MRVGDVRAADAGRPLGPTRGSGARLVARKLWSLTGTKPNQTVTHRRIYVEQGPRPFRITSYAC